MTSDPDPADGAPSDAEGGGASGPARLRALLGRRPHGRRLVALVAAVVAALVVVATSAAYAIDDRLHGDQVAGGVRVAGIHVGGLDRRALVARLERLDAELGASKVEVAVERDASKDTATEDADEDFTTDAASLGLRVDVEATADDVMAAGRTGSLPNKVFGWLRSRIASREAPLTTRVDRKVALDAVAARAREGEDPPVEASIAVGKTTKVFVGVAGRAGQGLDAERLIRDLPRAVERGRDPIRVTARRGEVAPRFSKADADALAAEAERLASTPLPLEAGSKKGELSSTTLRSLLSSTPGPERLELVIDGAAAAKAAAKALVSAGTAAKEPTFAVNAAGGVDITPGAVGQSCCGPEAPAILTAAIRSRPAGPVQLQLVEAAPKLSLEAAQGLGIKELVATFTTNHAAGQPRVTNIHRIADLVKGQVILPGQTLSINDLVGPRTTEKGFVVDKVIEEGKFAESVGGGISQFATTMFNAAWFAGLEFGEYQSHSLYISRYPYGREATLNFPHPDLKVKNPTPHGILVWPTYTNRSITVALFSTKWATVEAAGQEKVPDGSCTKVLAKRKRTFLDGRVVMDSTTARYRANEGQNCGDDEPPPPDGASTTTRPSGPTTTRSGATTTTRAPATTTTKKPTTPTSAAP